MAREAKPTVTHSQAVEDEFNWSLEADWASVEKKIGTFLVSIDKWASEQKHILKEMGIHHHESIKIMEDSKVDLEREIEEERERERIMLKELEEEREHHANLQRYNQELQVAVNRATEQQTTLDSELIKLRHEMMALKIDKQRQKKVLVEQKELDAPEVQKVEYLLGWKIEAVKPTTIWNRFTQIDPKDPEREFSMLIDFSDGDRYAVPNCSPPLGGLQDLVAQLNEDRDLYTFIKRVRAGFRDQLIAAA
ncbi:hypothetical protein NliqN6_5595 [Naganishia liquefaciens]|uniref:Kinetochore protein SPC25 n=1 Tax=Naganishia liquefaciens TaxID=104408 RepID=A0A8H3TYJ5_9TREE|nr:hypothetical protein NliqN6_5595 [Naganishia liquefaciens]